MSKHLDPRIWGPHYWFFLHTTTMCYPVSPNNNDKKRMYELITNLPFLFPKSQLSSTFHSLLDEYPLAPYLDSRDSLVRWMHFIHNKVNRLLDKPKISLATFYVKYYEAYNSNNVSSYQEGISSTVSRFLPQIGKALYVIILVLVILFIRKYYA